MSIGTASFDPHAGLLGELLEVLDRHFQQIDQDIRESPDPDAFGEFDRGEHLLGLAFVACHTYIAATCGRFGVGKREALAVGEPIGAELTKAGLVNHAANYWKHHRESRVNTSDRAFQRTCEALTTAGIPPDSSYPLSNVLGTLLQAEAPKLDGLTKVMNEWRVELEEGRRRTKA
jgi:hypothetical protein